MNLTLAYWKRSVIRGDRNSLLLSLEPNLRRDRVSYEGALSQPLRFREAISALHDIVISDLRYKPKDKTAYEAYRQKLKAHERAIRTSAAREIQQQALAQAPESMPEEFEQRFRQLRRAYWDARQKYSNYLNQHDPEMWRLLMPCDPVITVAPDVLLFECFSADESSYGCLSVNRQAFTREQSIALGTTNVDYSWALYEHFQTLRSYRETRFLVDPTGFELRTQHGADYREEKIDLPNSWLRGFLQLQSAMSLPMRRVPVSREGLYNVLAWLKRHKAAKSPRAMRFELEPGKPISMVLEPWERRITLHHAPYQGPRPETIRTWGRDRLRVLARLLPLVEHAEVHLVGTGFPSFWVLHLGDMKLTLGLSGWTTNDWTHGGSALDQLAPPIEPSEEVIGEIAGVFKQAPMQTFRQIQRKTGAAPAFVAAGLNRLAHLGQVIHDLANGVYRWRQVMPVSMSVDQLGQESPETTEARKLAAERTIRVTRNEQLSKELWILQGHDDDMLTHLVSVVQVWAGSEPKHEPIELLLDGDGRMIRGRCGCSHHHRFGLRAGPCRHLQALRMTATKEEPPSTLDSWFQQFVDFMTLADE